MKQHITIQQLREIESKQKEKLVLVLDNWNEYRIKEGYLSDHDISSQCTIGKMIEILQNVDNTEFSDLYSENKWRVYKNGMWHDFPVTMDWDGLCDQLWEAVKTCLE